MNTIQIMSTHMDEYELLDSGNGRKLERYGKNIIARPESQALWRPHLPSSEWKKAYATFEKTDEKHGEWVKKDKEYQWAMSYNDLKFWVKLTPFGHTGVFPEQAAHWDWISEKVKTANTQLKVLSLFTYTGISSLAAAAAGAQVTHIDASGPAVTWARENQTISKLTDKPIRWIVEDAMKFVQREARRGNKYDALIMDPPKFGRGPDGEVWKFEKSFEELLEECKKILNPSPAFVLITAYAIPISSLSLGNLMQELVFNKEGTIEVGELTIPEKDTNRILSTALFSRWSA